MRAIARNKNNIRPLSPHHSSSLTTYDYPLNHYTTDPWPLTADN
jgi:hypothetical protein